MRNRFPLIMLASLVVIGGLVWTFVATNQGSLVTLQGSILKIRTFPLTPQSTLVLADFRVTNPSKLPFVVDKLEMFVDRPGGDPVSGDILSRADVELVFQYQKLTGPKYNDPLIAANKIQPGETVDRMSAARVDLPEAQIDGRTAVRIRIHEFNHQVAEIAEAGKQK